MGRLIGALRAAIAGVCALALLAMAAAANAAPALWVMRDKDSTIYLFGTMHALGPDTDWRTPLFDEAYERSRIVWFETDMNIEPSAVSLLMVKYGYDPKRTLSEKLPPKTLARLEQVLKGSPITLASIEHMRPWAVALRLSAASMMESGLDPEKGADATLTADAEATQAPPPAPSKPGRPGRPAKPAGPPPKTIRTFETLEQQIRIFADLPEAAEIAFLDDVLSPEPSPGDLEGGDLQGVWSRGEIVAVGALMIDSMRRERPDLYRAMIKSRNEAWADELDRAMQGRGVGMVNVGALHLIGSDGLPMLLRARGYRVERIQ